MFRPIEAAYLIVMTKLNPIVAHPIYRKFSTLAYTSLAVGTWENAGYRISFIRSKLLISFYDGAA